MHVSFLSSHVESLNGFKKVFLDNLTLDKFAIVQNGILPQVFSVEKDVDISKYSNSTYLKALSNIDFQKKIVASYENFIHFIKSEDEVIDYKYIWDLVCLPKNQGGILFDKGINLLILNSPHDDILSKIQLICPTNHYSNNFFDAQKKTLMVYSKDNYYEPLFKIKSTGENVFDKDLNKGGKGFMISRFMSDRDFKVFKDNSEIVKYNRQNSRYVYRILSSKEK